MEELVGESHGLGVLLEEDSLPDTSDGDGVEIDDLRGGEVDEEAGHGVGGRSGFGDGDVGKLEERWVVDGDEGVKVGSDDDGVLEEEEGCFAED